MIQIKKLVLFLSSFLILGVATHTNADEIYNSTYDNTALNHPTQYEKGWARNFILDIKHDFTGYMKSDNLLLLGDTFIVAGVLANTGLDRSFANHWQTDIRNSTVNHILEVPCHAGSLSIYYLPLYLGTMGLGHLREHTGIGNTVYHWGYRSLRTFILGGLQQVILTNLIGSGRPNKNEDSKWQPFKYQTGVSGHAFYGAIPFLTAAMMSDPPLLRYGLYAFSVLPGVSRINSNRHYLSQVILGWGLAYLSARTVYNSDLERSPTFRVNVYPRSDGAMLAAHLQF